MTEQEKLREEAHREYIQFMNSDVGNGKYPTLNTMNVVNFAASFAAKKLAEQGANADVDEWIKSFLESLGSHENEYSLYCTDGEWWICHDHVGSGEPLRQALKSKLTNKE